MDVFFKNLHWMQLNVALALIAASFAWLFSYVKPWYLKVPAFLLWLLFLPNTIYLVTDLQYLPEQLAKTTGSQQLALVLQFVFLAIVGVLTFFYALYQVQHYLITKYQRKNRQAVFILIALINYLVAFGVLLGKIERTHSWYVFTQFPRAYEDMIRLATSPVLLTIAIVSGSLINFIYFTTRKIRTPKC